MAASYQPKNRTIGKYTQESDLIMKRKLPLERDLIYDLNQIRQYKVKIYICKCRQCRYFDKKKASHEKKNFRH